MGSVFRRRTNAADARVVYSGINDGPSSTRKAVRATIPAGFYR